MSQVTNKTEERAITPVEQKVCDIAMGCLEKGKMIWEMPCVGINPLARNHVSGKLYQNSNQYLTWVCSFAEYKRNEWITFNQLANKMGYTKIRMGKFWTWNDKDGNKVKHTDLKSIILKDPDAETMPIEFWKPTIRLVEGWKWIKSFDVMQEMIDSGEYTREDFRIVYPTAPKTYYVYNVEQTNLVLPKPKKMKKLKKSELEKVFKEMLSTMKNAPALEVDGKNPCYSPSKHTIHMPSMYQFVMKNEEFGLAEAHWFHSASHELAHSSGHEDCLNREGITNSMMWGDHRYAEEEIVAETCAEMIAQHYNFDRPETTKNTEAYLQSWMEKLNKDPKIMARALRNSSKAFQYILGL